jgi:hypothetical protein
LLTHSLSDIFFIRDSRIKNINHSRPLSMLKAQDFLVALKLVALAGQRWTYAQLAHELGLSASEAHAAVKRGVQAGLLIPNFLRAISKNEMVEGQVVPASPALVHQQNLAEFAVYGAKYAFAAERAGMTVGMPTSHSAPAFAHVFAAGSDDFVWPFAEGIARGEAIAPLHPNVPYAAQKDAKLYEMLALFDALRVGRVRERGMAIKRLPALIHVAATKMGKHG